MQIAEQGMNMNTYMITGGTGGLGLATARLLAQQANTQVVLAVRDTDNAQRLTQGWNENVHIRYLNLADLNEVDRFIAEWDLPLAGLMNNAGITKWEKAEVVAENDWREVIDINLNGLFFCTQEVAKQMIVRKSGSIINIASMSGLIVNKPQEQASYNTSKAAVIHLTKSLAAEWAQPDLYEPVWTNNEYDAGPIIAQAAVPVLPDDTEDTLAARVLAAEHRVYPMALRLVASGKARVIGEQVVIDGPLGEAAPLFSPPVASIQN